MKNRDKKRAWRLYVEIKYDLWRISASESIESLDRQVGSIIWNCTTAMTYGVPFGRLYTLLDRFLEIHLFPFQEKWEEFNERKMNTEEKAAYRSDFKKLWDGPLAELTTELECLCKSNEE